MKRAVSVLVGYERYAGAVSLVCGFSHCYLFSLFLKERTKMMKAACNYSLLKISAKFPMQPA